MTRKDFELIAETIRFAPATREVRVMMANEFAGTLKRANPAFKPERFIIAATKPRADDLAIAAE